MSLAAFCGSPLAPTQDLCTKRHFAHASVQHDVSVYLESICLTLSQVCIQFRMIRVGVAGVSATPYSCKWDLTSFARTSHGPMLHIKLDRAAVPAAAVAVAVVIITIRIRKASTLLLLLLLPPHPNYTALKAWLAVPAIIKILI